MPLFMVAPDFGTNEGRHLHTGLQKDQRSSIITTSASTPDAAQEGFSTITTSDSTLDAT